MYKCTECGCEFEIKPDFCDCGNNEFVITHEIREKEKNDEPEIIQKKQEPHVQIGKKNIQEQKEVKKTSAEIFHPILSKIEPVSLSVFLICIILSVVIICIKPKQTDSEENYSSLKQETAAKDIPNIDKFWNNKVKETSAPAPVKEELQPIKVKINLQPTSAKQKTVSQKPKTTTVQLKKATAQKTQQNSAATKTQTTQKTTPQNKTQSTTQVRSNTLQQTAKPAITKQETTVPQAIQQKPAQTTIANVQTSLASKEELANYKAKLRNTIGQKIDFTKVIGDGSCIVSFKIDSTGKLINRSFTKQSDNITLNDAVYKAVMATPRYNIPPGAYNNETLNLNIKFYNGNFEISLH